MMSAAHPYHGQVRPALLNWGRRCHRFDVLRGVAAWALLLGGVVAVLTLTELALSPPPPWRLLAFALGVTVLVLAVITCIRHHRHAPGLPELARAAERQLGLPPDALCTVVSVFERPSAGVSAGLAEAVARELMPRLRQPPVPGTLQRRAGLWTVAATASWLVWSLAMFQFPSLLWASARLLLPWASLDAPYAQRLSLFPQDTVIEQGQALQWSATLAHPPRSTAVDLAAAGNVPVLELSFDRQTWSTLPMSPRGAAGFIARLDRVDRDLWFRGVYGRVSTPVYLARVKTQPAFRSVDVEVTYPASLGGAVVRLQPQREPGGTLLTSLPAGASVRVGVTLTEPAQQVTLTGNALTVDGRPEGPSATTWWLRLPPQSTATPSQSARLQLVAVGLRGGSARETLTLLTLADADPTLRLIAPRPDTTVTARDTLDVVLLGEDDVGIESAEVRLRTPRGTTTVPVPVRTPTRRLRVATPISLAMLSLTPGETVGVSAVLRDTSGRVAVSEEVTVRVALVSPDPMLTARLASLTDVGRAVVTAGQAMLRAADALDDLARSPPEARMLGLTSGRLDVAAAADSVGRLERLLPRLARSAGDGRFADAVAALADRVVPARLAAEAALRGSADAGAEQLTLLSGQLRSSAGELARDVAEPVRRLRRGDAAKLLLTARDAAHPLIPSDDASLLHVDERELDDLLRGATATLAELPPPVLTQPREVAADVLAARLDLAWRIEALRPDALPQRAADLAAVAALAGQVRPPPATRLTSLLERLEREHLAARAGAAADPAIVAQAAAAREELSSLERGRETPLLSATPADLTLLTAPAGRDDAEMRRATRLADLARRAREISLTLARLARPIDARTTASVETMLRDLLRSIESDERTARPATLLPMLPPLTPLEPRLATLRTIAAAESRLVELDQRLDRLRELLARHARLMSRPELAAAELAGHLQQLEDALLAADPAVAVGLRDELRRASSELATAALAAETGLLPSLQQLAGTRGSLSTGDLSPVISALEPAVAAVRRTLAELEDARAAIARRDPLAAARTAVSAAAAALRRRDPDIAIAARFSASAADALDLAAEQARRARNLRLLAMLPELMAYANPDVEEADAPPAPPNRPPRGDVPANAAPAAGSSVRPPDEAIDALAGPESLKQAVRAYFDLLEQLPTLQTSPPGGRP